MSNELEQIKNILANFAVHVNKCHKDGSEPNLNPWADLFESLLSKQLEQHAMKMAGILAQADQKLTIYRADLLEKVEGLKKEDNLHPEMDEFGENCQCYECSSRDGFNQSLDQVLTLIKGDECKQ